MDLNNVTIILIIILLLIIYLLDNVKELEDNILKKSNINETKSKYYQPRRKYFRDINININDNNLKKELKKILETEKDNIVLPPVLPLHKPASFINLAEKEVKIPSNDKFITGVSAPGSTTMDIYLDFNKEHPLFVDNVEERFDFRFTDYEQ